MILFVGYFTYSYLNKERMEDLDLNTKLKKTEEFNQKNDEKSEIQASNTILELSYKSSDDRGNVYEINSISGSLSKDNNSLLFYPDAYLTRENLIIWKVPLDFGKGLSIIPTIDIEKNWGFQDIKTINLKALQALYIDFHNKEKSNIRRIFGYTILFQPQKPVTLAEAIASLWYFGYQEKGISARDILQK